MNWLDVGIGLGICAGVQWFGALMGYLDGNTEDRCLGCAFHVLIVLQLSLSS